jgi:hypothetical protein
MLGRWTQDGGGGRSMIEISEYNNFVDDKKGQHNFLFIV